MGKFVLIAYLTAAYWVAAVVLISGSVWLRGDCGTDMRPNGMHLCQHEGSILVTSLFAAALAGYAALFVAMVRRPS